MRKPTFCICENKDADQLRGNREADQRLCFCLINSTVPLLSKKVGFLMTRLIYMEILPLPRIHEEQLSAAGERYGKKVHKVLAHYFIEACLRTVKITGPA